MALEWRKLPSRATNCSFTGLTADHLARLVALGSARGRWYLPLVTTYTIRMQSNPFARHVRDRPADCS
jgi:hypothetical protein